MMIRPTVQRPTQLRVERPDCRRCSSERPAEAPGPPLSSCPGTSGSVLRSQSPAATPHCGRRPRACFGRHGRSCWRGRVRTATIFTLHKGGERAPSVTVVRESPRGDFGEVGARDHRESAGPKRYVSWCERWMLLMPGGGAGECGPQPKGSQMPAKPDAPDDLEALRNVVAALEPFDARDRERIIRWACEKLTIAVPADANPVRAEPQAPTPPTSLPTATPVRPSVKRDLRTFIAEKTPASDTHFATAVAYYYQFDAPESERKNAITASDLTEACRLADRARLPHPGQTLRNAMRDGLLDRAERGAFKVNAVGENLVAMALPTGTPRTAKSAAKPRRRSAKKPGTAVKPRARKKVGETTTRRRKRR